MALRLGDIAPDFTAETTEGTISFHDWKAGSWTVFFSHPKDYTPVCTTELGYTAKLKDEFDKRNVKAIALSVDSVEDHNGWVGDIAETFSPDRVQGFVWDVVAAYAHYFANAPHEEADPILQWCGRELERGFRARRFDAVRTARVFLWCEAAALPGARIESGEVLASVRAEQEPDGGWLCLDDPAASARVEHTLDALAVLARLR